MHAAPPTYVKPYHLTFTLTPYHTSSTTDTEPSLCVTLTALFDLSGMVTEGVRVTLGASTLTLCVGGPASLMSCMADMIPLRRDGTSEIADITPLSRSSSGRNRVLFTLRVGESVGVIVTSGG